MSKELNQTKMQILSLGSLGGMFIGSLITYLFPKLITLIIFMICFFFAIWGIKQFYLFGKFS